MKCQLFGGRSSVKFLKVGSKASSDLSAKTETSKVNLVKMPNIY